MKLRFTRRAVDNITELADNIRARNPEAAEAVRNAIYDSLTNLILFPNVGRLQTPKVFVSS
ncbi:MAG: type II toxin-antitoxin system RelE/ParE family toxin [Methyloceanibacter sp.]|jgi:toxin ParE1/3/4|nr:type II toxin-antitoxin system RelE/ParE family toxin [Methyloceanibacter sp.]